MPRKIAECFKIIIIDVYKKPISFSETVPQSIWNELPDHLKKEIQVGTANQQQVAQRMNYDF